MEVSSTMSTSTSSGAWAWWRKARLWRCAPSQGLGQCWQVDVAGQAGAEFGQGLVDGLAQARSGFAGGCGQGHLEVAGLRVGGPQQRQQAGSGVGFSSAGAAGHDRQARTQGQGAGTALPVGFGAGGCAGVGWAKQAVQPLAHLRRVHQVLGAGALGHAVHHSLFVLPVAAQIQQGRVGAAGQHQGLASVVVHQGVGLGKQVGRWLGLQGGHLAHHGAALQGLEPLGQGRCVFGPPAAERGVGGIRPGEHALGGAVQHGQGQTGVATPFQVGQHGGGHEQLGCGLGVLTQHKGGQLAVERAQPAGVCPGMQGLQCGFGGGVGCGFGHGPVWVDGWAGVSIIASSASSMAVGAPSTQQPCSGPCTPRKNRYTAPPRCWSGW